MNKENQTIRIESGTIVRAIIIVLLFVALYFERPCSSYFSCSGFSFRHRTCNFMV